MNLKIFACALLLTGCSESLSPVQLIDWLEKPDNGSTVEHTEKNYVLRCTLLPADLLAYKQFHVLEEPYTDSAFEALEEEYGSGRYFKFSIDFKENAPLAKQFFEQHSDYLNFYMAGDLVLVSDGDSLPCSLANMERSANISPRLTYEIAFDVPKGRNEKDFTVVYRGELSDNKPLAFGFQQTDLKNIPHLKR